MWGSGRALHQGPGAFPSLCIHSQYHLGPRLPTIIPSTISKPNHDQKQKRFLFLCIQELPHKGLELLTHTGKGDQSEGRVMGRGKGPVCTCL